MKINPSKIWARFVDYVPYDENRYTAHASSVTQRVVEYLTDM